MKMTATALFAFLFLPFLLSAQAQAKTLVTKEQANNYYQHCREMRDPRMSPESQDAMCACTSVKIMENMTMEEVQLMGGDNTMGRKMLNKMLTDVYAPCMNFPLQDILGVQCLEDSKIDLLGLKMSKGELCSCIAERTSMWFVKEGRSMMRRILVVNPNLVDPIEPVMESREFKKKAYDNMVACLAGEGG